MFAVIPDGKKKKKERERHQKLSVLIKKDVTCPAHESPFHLFLLISSVFLLTLVTYLSIRMFGCLEAYQQQILWAV